MARKTAPKPSAKPAADRHVPVLEWVMAVFGLALVIAALTVILDGAFAVPGPPEIEARLISARPVPDGWRGEIEVRNTGGATAAGVAIEGRLGDQTAGATIDYVPAGGRERVVLGFEDDPRAGLALIVRGWSEP